ncbi:hypothetical protein V9T40_001291 [Parthenolecanium corni]|uniref:PurE domain-containing protein n=1 Tax=Parthenolecanium corni TaxID=536013 RepID=A0AAN9Y199_9HEMI
MPINMPRTEFELKNKLAEGKTKEIWEISKTEVIVLSKDRITAWNGAKGHTMVNKSIISNQTTSNIFTILKQAGIRTAFIEKYKDNSFRAERCEMIPIEWVTRRLATGSFLKRCPGVEEGTKFYPPLVETFFKDDANDDPQWSDQQIIAAQFKLNGLKIGRAEVQCLKKMTSTIFEILEKYWATQDCVLVDMKIEFGVNSSGQILLADVIDNDSWRLWPSGDKRLMKDKQVYRNLAEVTDKDLLVIKENFQWVADKTELLKHQSSNCLVVIIMGSKSDEEFCRKIGDYCKKLGLPFTLRVSSAHKSTDDVLQVISEYDGSSNRIVYIAVAGRSNGLGLVIAANSISPVINCPPPSNDLSRDIWSSLSLPSGLGCSTVVNPEAAALSAAHIFALNDCNVWAKLRARQLNNFVSIKEADKFLNQQKESEI